MVHPYAEHRQHKVERERASHMTKGYATGGAVKGHPDETEDKKLIRAEVKKGALKKVAADHGKKPHARLDRKARGGKVKKQAASDDGYAAEEKADERLTGEGMVKRAKGGRVNKGKTTVNVIVSGGDKQAQPVPIPVPSGPPPGAAAMPPPRPPGMMPPAGPAMPPGQPMPMPPHRNGGRAYANGGSVYEEGRRHGTQVTHTKGKNDQDDIDTSRPILTRKRGGRTMNQLDDAGAGSGPGRLEKTAMQKRTYP